MGAENVGEANQQFGKIKGHERKPPTKINTRNYTKDWELSWLSQITRPFVDMDDLMDDQYADQDRYGKSRLVELY